MPLASEPTILIYIIANEIGRKRGCFYKAEDEKVDREKENKARNYGSWAVSNGVSFHL